MKSPKISVLMSCFNAQATVVQTIESILNQTFEEFEFIIINDGSKDNTQGIIESFNDNRIKIINQKNIGLTKSLNKGINHSKADLIARVDADDVCDPKRLKLQYDRFSKENDLVLLGTKVIYKTSNTIKKSSFLSDSEILKKIKVLNPLAHSSVMFRKQAMLDVKGYNESYKTAQDYDAWLKLSKRGKVSMINKFLVTVNLSQNTISRNKLFNQAVNGYRIRRDNVNVIKNMYYTARHIFLGLIPIKFVEIKRALFDG